MGCRILVDKNTGETCFYCSTTMVAFGPVMDSEEKALGFLKWMKDERYETRPDIKALLKDHDDPRSYSESDLLHLYWEFIRSVLNKDNSI